MYGVLPYADRPYADQPYVAPPVFVAPPAPPPIPPEIILAQYGIDLFLNEGPKHPAIPDLPSPASGYFIDPQPGTVTNASHFLTVTEPAQVGQLLAIWVSTQANSAQTILSVTDTRNNVWKTAAFNTSGSQMAAILIATCTSPLQVGDQVTILWSGNINGTITGRSTTVYGVGVAFNGYEATVDHVSVTTTASQTAWGSVSISPRTPNCLMLALDCMPGNPLQSVFTMPTPPSSQAWNTVGNPQSPNGHLFWAGYTVDPTKATVNINNGAWNTANTQIVLHVSLNQYPPPAVIPPIPPDFILNQEGFGFWLYEINPGIHLKLPIPAYGSDSLNGTDSNVRSNIYRVQQMAQGGIAFGSAFTATLPNPAKYGNTIIGFFGQSGSAAPVLPLNWYTDINNNNVQLMLHYYALGGEQSFTITTSSMISGIFYIEEWSGIAFADATTDTTTANPSLVTSTTDTGAAPTLAANSITFNFILGGNDFGTVGPPSAGWQNEVIL